MSLPSLPGAAGYVYFFAQGELVKIGRTAGTVQARLSEIRRMSATPESLIARAAIPAASRNENNQAERDLHLLFDPERRHGEWFVLSPRIELAIAVTLKAWGIPTGPDLHPAGIAEIRKQTHEMEAAVENWNVLVVEWWHRWRHLTLDRLDSLSSKSATSLPTVYPLPVPIAARLPQWAEASEPGLSTVAQITREVASL